MAPDLVSVFARVESEAVNDRWPVLQLLRAGVPVTLLVDLFPVHGPDSEHIYREELTPDDTGVGPRTRAAALVGAGDASSR